MMMMMIIIIIIILIIIIITIMIMIIIINGTRIQTGSESASKAVFTMVGNRRKIIQFGMLVFLETH